ncbi:MAG: hypothetical protein ABH871_01540 [Pseudomonadota bacterium]
MSLQSNIRRRAFSALAVRRDGENAKSLLDYMSERESSACEDLIERFEKQVDRDQALEQMIRQMVASERFSSLAEVHPAWILEALKAEPPRVVGLILRSLPSNHVRYLLEHLPPMLRERIPNMVESFAVDPMVLEVIRRRFEANFKPMRVSRLVVHPGFEYLYFLRREELSELVRDIGLWEMAIALSGMSQKALHMIFNRLDLKDAKRLKRYIDGMKRISTELYRQARFNLLEIEGQHEGSERMLFSIGLVALACAAGENDKPFLELLMQKLEPGDGYLLKRFMDERRRRINEAVATERQTLILRLVAQLASDGRISAEWRRFSPDYQEAAGKDENPIPEETASIVMQDTEEE